MGEHIWLIIDTKNSDVAVYWYVVDRCGWLLVYGNRDMVGY